jgi:8-oxo-dGTP pyrophosphatase MutT (NUDIX family)
MSESPTAERELLCALLQAYVPSQGDAPTAIKESSDLRRMRAFAVTLAAPFSRLQVEAHFTGSAVVVDPAGSRVCLVHHRKLLRWLQPGGHADPADVGDMARTALREAHEETGMNVQLHPAAPNAIDVDIHTIPARNDESAHAHLDVRFLVQAEDPTQLQHDPGESFGARWLDWDAALAAADEPALTRLLTKARLLCQPG